jgi:hypothetical protein
MKHHLFAVFFIALFPFVEPYAFIKWPWQQESKQAKPTPGSADFIYNNCAREVKLHFLKQQYPNSTLISRESFVKDLSKMPTNMSESYLHRKRCQLKKMIEVSGLNNLLSFIEQDFHQIGKLLIQTNLTLENFKKADKLLAQCQEVTEKKHLILLDASQGAYHNKAPEGYKVIKTFDDPQSGFKAFIFEKKNLKPGEKPTQIISFTGTEDKIDRQADATFGVKQYNRNHNEVLSYVNKFIQEGGKVQFTGHSLGGGLAQAFAHKAIANFKKNNSTIDPISMKRIEVVTWNAFGAKPLIEMRQDFDEDLIGTRFDDQMVHYRVAGDSVSRLGEFPMGQIRTMSTKGIKNSDLGDRNHGLINFNVFGWRESSNLNVVNAHNFPGIRASIEKHGLQTSMPGKDPEAMIPAGAAAKVIANWYDLSGDDDDEVGEEEQQNPYHFSYISTFGREEILQL